MTSDVTDGSDVIGAARECAELLRGASDRAWDAPVPEMDWTVAEVVAHAIEGCLWYAIDLAAGGRDLELVEHRIDPTARPDALTAAMETYARLLSWAVDHSDPDARGFHPLGMADPSGFAAMGCDELLVHTDDAARGLGLTFEPDSGRCERVLRRLFPWAPTDVDPWEGLRWANGRTALGDLPRLEGWSWHCAPLDEWDGQNPTDPA